MHHSEQWTVKTIKKGKIYNLKLTLCITNKKKKNQNVQNSTNMCSLCMECILFGHVLSVHLYLQTNIQHFSLSCDAMRCDVGLNELFLLFFFYFRVFIFVLCKCDNISYWWNEFYKPSHPIRLRQPMEITLISMET